MTRGEQKAFWLGVAANLAAFAILWAATRHMPKP